MDCPVCGIYRITSRARDVSLQWKDDESTLLECVAETIKVTQAGLNPSWVANRGPREETDKSLRTLYLDDYKGRTFRHADKPDLLLKLLAEKLRGRSPGATVKLTDRDLYSIRIKGSHEAAYWLSTLLSYVSCPQLEAEAKTHSGPGQIERFDFRLTPAGWARVEELFRGIRSKKAFIALSFRCPERIEIQSAIQRACTEAGWDGFTIDAKEYIGGITDEIVASINESAFVIAEFTENKHGVYYEAGYAAGLGLPVIYIVKDEKEHIEGLHFDTKHLNHITWKDYADLETKLKNRIRAVINREQPN